MFRSCVCSRPLSHRNLLQRVFVRHAQPAPQLVREALVALFAHRLLVVLVKLGLLVHLVVADRAGKVVHAPGLVERGEH